KPHVFTLARALPPVAPVVLTREETGSLVWRPADDGLEARLEHRAMTALAARLADDPDLAALARELAAPRHGALAAEPGA
ncbi:MAG: hypothetical protein U1C74_11830, partial [Phenylobacterium sp.]|nr:hypothetical protein [Phenylobacterium sp.]